MDSEKIASGKIAFIFPAKFNTDGATSPTLNFSTRSDGVIAMSVGISFVELDPNTPYFIMLDLFEPNGNNVQISSGMAVVPHDQIDPVRKTSFLTASFYFRPETYGTYRFSCELSTEFTNERYKDTKDIFFNVSEFGK